MAPPKSISISFYNEVRDHIAAQRLLYQKSMMAKVDKVVAVLLLCIGAIGVIFVGAIWWTLMCFPLAVLEWFDLLSVRPLVMRVAFRRNSKFREEYHLTFSPENIGFKTLSIDSTLQWTYYQRVIESARLFLLMYGKDAYTLIPKRCFKSEDELNAFRALLAEKIPQ